MKIEEGGAYLAKNDDPEFAGLQFRFRVIKCFPDESGGKVFLAVKESDNRVLAGRYVTHWFDSRGAEISDDPGFDKFFLVRRSRAAPAKTAKKILL